MEIEGLEVEPVQTNILFVDVKPAAKEKATTLIAALKEQGILATGLYRLRFVTHLHTTDEGIDKTIAAVRHHFS
jgi:threonine aldolase